ncbi:MAG: hypothetical protein GC159_13145 [Phycisphaera sp.]|nr:hypothetical protein [Phycisphaera sp.]
MKYPLGLMCVAVVLGSVGRASAVDPPTPTAVSPRADAQISAISAEFRWSIEKDDTSYDVQVASDAAFATVVRHLDAVEVPKLQQHGCYIPDLPTGDYHWRVRTRVGDRAGAWSKPIRFSVIDAPPARPPAVPLTNRQPLFMFYVRPAGLSDMVNAIPATLRRNVVFGGGLLDSPDELKKWTPPRGEPGDPYVWAAVNPSGMKSGLPEIEWLFQHCPNVIGVSYAEFTRELWTRPWEQDHLAALIELCARYGRYLMWADGISGADPWLAFCDAPRFASLLKRYGDHIVLGHKSNISVNAWASQSEVLGMWLDGVVGHQQEHLEAWYWEAAGFGDRLDLFFGRHSAKFKTGGDAMAMPPGFHLQQWTAALARGVEVYTLGAPVYSIAGDRMRDCSATAVMAKGGQPTNVFNDYYLPWMRFVVDNEMTPDRAAVEANVGLRLVAAPLPSDHGNYAPLAAYLPAFDAAYGIDQTPWKLKPERQLPASGNTPMLWESLPNSGEHGLVAIMPANASAGATPPAIPTTSFNATALRRMVAIDSSNVFAAVWNDSRFVAVNASENKNITGSFEVRFKDGPARSIGGPMTVHKYLLGRRDARSVVMHLNGSPRIVRDADPPLWSIDDSTLYITADAEPRVSVTPAEALVETRWDAAARRLALTLRHAYAPVYDNPQHAATRRDESRKRPEHLKPYQLRGGPINITLAW